MIPEQDREETEDQLIDIIRKQELTQKTSEYDIKTYKYTQNTRIVNINGYLHSTTLPDQIS